jgi:hypothetical protein
MMRVLPLVMGTDKNGIHQAFIPSGKSFPINETDDKVLDVSFICMLAIFQNDLNTLSHQCHPIAIHLYFEMGLHFSCLYQCGKARAAIPWAGRPYPEEARAAHEQSRP